MLLISLFQYHSNLHFLETLSGGYLNSLEYWPRRRILAFAVEFLICLIHDIPVDAINSLVKPDICTSSIRPFCHGLCSDLMFLLSFSVDNC
jgi:hypothetical protein